MDDDMPPLDSPGPIAPLLLAAAEPARLLPPPLLLPLPPTKPATTLLPIAAATDPIVLATSPRLELASAKPDVGRSPRRIDRDAPV